MQNNDKRRLELMGITFNQIESGVYALILREITTDRRLPIIIGYPEAQAIECKLQEVVTPRPLTHDLMVSILAPFNLTLEEIFIHKLPNGVFAADLVMTDGKKRVIVDARSSDAIALAIRVGAPIYTSSILLDEAAYSPSGKKTKRTTVSGATNESLHLPSSDDPSEMSDARLEEELNQAVAEENYERASILKKEIDRRNDSLNNSDIS